MQPALLVTACIIRCPLACDCVSRLCVYAVGAASYTVVNSTITCTHDMGDAVHPPASGAGGRAANSSLPAPSGGGGGTPSWVWALVGTLAGLAAAAAAVAGVAVWRRRQQLQRVPRQGSAAESSSKAAGKEGSASGRRLVVLDTEAASADLERGLSGSVRSGSALSSRPEEGAGPAAGAFGATLWQSRWVGGGCWACWNCCPLHPCRPLLLLAQEC